jgi:hypothetical protein
MALDREDIERIAKASAHEVMVCIRERESDLDILHGTVAGPGAVPLHGRETRKEPCWGCRIDPTKPLEAGNIMATTKDAIGTLSQDEVRQWCSELVEVEDGRCARARGIREAAATCKEKYPDDTKRFFECFAPAFAGITKERPMKCPNCGGKLDEHGCCPKCGICVLK